MEFSSSSKAWQQPGRNAELSSSRPEKTDGRRLFQEGTGYEEIGPEGQSPGFPFAGGLGAQTAATASSGSRERMRGRA